MQLIQKPDNLPALHNKEKSDRLQYVGKQRTPCTSEWTNKPTPIHVLGWPKL